MSYMRLKNVRRKRARLTSNVPGRTSRKSSASDNYLDDLIDQNNVQMIESSGNVFLDLGFPPEEANSLFVRALLMNHITEVIRARRMTQRTAARLFGVTQPRISNLKNGKIELFSIDSLVEMLSRAGMQVTVDVKSAA